MPLLQPELYAGSVSQDDNGAVILPQPVTLQPGTAYGLEDLATGQVHEVDEAASTSTRLVLETAARLQRAALRPHQTLAHVLPADGFSPEDRVLAFDSTSNSFQANPVDEEGAWSSGDWVLRPEQGWIVHVRSVEVTQLLTGQVGVKARIQPAGTTSLRGSRSVVAESPAGLGLEAAAGHRSSEKPTSAARLRLWKPDAEAGAAAGYDQLYLSPGGWRRQEDGSGADLSQEPLLLPFRAFFLLP